MRIRRQDIFLDDHDEIYFGNNQEAILVFADNDLHLNHTISGTAATQGYHLVRRDQVPEDFLDLDDTPTTYSGAAGYCVKIKEDESGVEFTTISGLFYIPLPPAAFILGDAGTGPGMRVAGPVSGYAFDDTNEESCYTTFRIPHSYVSNTDISIEFCCFNNDTQSGTNSVVWAVDYHIYKPGDLYTSKTTSTYTTAITFPNNATAGTFEHISVTIPYNDTNNPLTFNRAFTLRLYRDATSGSDTITGDVVLVMSNAIMNINVGD